MDPICHTLVGATLAGTRLGDRSWGAKATLLIAANLPDVDVVSLAWGENATRAWRRGWTHGVLAIAVAPMLLAWLVGWWGRRSGQEVNFRWLVTLSYLGFLTHPVLDWLNTYGMRWLMPFDGTWFYGDALYIVDPWMWLIPGAAAFLRYSASRRAVTSWIVLGLLLSLPVFLLGTSLTTRILWSATILGLVALRLRGRVPTAAAQATCVCALGLATAYVVGMMTLQHQAHTALVDRTGKRPAEVFVGPLPAQVDTRDVLLVEQHGYTPGVYRIGGEFATSNPVAIESEDTRAFAALITPCAQGIADWLRFPFFRIEELADGGSLVHLLDARYVQSAQPGFGMWTVEFDADGHVVGCP